MPHSIGRCHTQVHVHHVFAKKLLGGTLVRCVPHLFVIPSASACQTHDVFRCAIKDRSIDRPTVQPLLSALVLPWPLIGRPRLPPTEWQEDGVGAPHIDVVAKQSDCVNTFIAVLRSVQPQCTQSTNVRFSRLGIRKTPSHSPTSIMEDCCLTDCASTTIFQMPNRVPPDV